MSRRLLSVASLLISTVLAFPAGAESEPMGPGVISTALRSTDLDKSVQYYQMGLGMVVARKIHLGPVTEVILGFEGKAGQPGILLFQDETPGKSPPVDEGNAASRVIMRMPDLAGTVARLTAAGYPAGEIHGNGNVKILNVRDPDGHSFELVEMPAGDVKLKGSNW